MPPKVATCEHFKVTRRDFKYINSDSYTHTHTHTYIHTHTHLHTHRGNFPLLFNLNLHKTPSMGHFLSQPYFCTIISTLSCHLYLIFKLFWFLQVSLLSFYTHCQRLPCVPFISPTCSYLILSS